MERLYGETTTQKNFKESKRNIDYLAQRRLQILPIGDYYKEE